MIAHIAIILYYFLSVQHIVCMENDSTSSTEEKKITHAASNITISSESFHTKKTSYFKRSSLTAKYSLKDTHPLDIKCLNLDIEHNKVDKNLNTPLIYAVQNNLIESVSLLMTYPTIEINHSNKTKNTALHFAAIYGLSPIIELLLQHPLVDASLTNNDGLKAHECLDNTLSNYNAIQYKLYMNVLLHLPKFYNKNYFDIERLKKNNQMDIVDTEGTSPLIWAIVYKSQETYPQAILDTFIIKQILSCSSANVNCKDTLFGTALHYATLLYTPDKPEIINLLLSDHRINASKKNIFKHFARDCITYDEAIEHNCPMPNKYIKYACPICDNVIKARNLRMALFSRVWLNIAIDEITFEVTLSKTSEECTTEFRLKNEIVDEIIDEIKKRIIQESKSQATKLPKTAGLPPYINDLFLEKMIHFSYIEKWLKKSINY